jgi:sigma-B regulation protein RsbU (phosphoserine phosphatase)
VTARRSSTATNGLLDLSAVDSQQLLEGLGDAVVVADERNRIVYINGSAEELLGWSRADLVGRPLVTIIPERLRPRHLEGFTRYQETGEARLIGAGAVQLPALRADETEVEVELTLSAHALGSGRQVFVASLRDVTDRLALEHERVVSWYLLAMREITARVAAAGDLVTVEQAGPMILTAIGESLGWDIGGIWKVEGDVLQPITSWAAHKFEEAAAAMEHGSRRLQRGEGVPGRVAATGEPAWIEDLHREANFPRRSLAQQYGLRSCFAFPIAVHGEVMAVVEFCSTHRGIAHPELLTAMTSAGNEIGRLFEQADARRQVTESRRHLIGLAEALQASLLPPRPPVIPGMELAARYRAAAGEGQVGGDFFDVFPLADGGWAVAVGDVSGRGPRAAALTALARYTIRAAAVGSPRGSDVLRVLNDVVLRELETTDELGERFLTVAFLVLQPVGEGMAVRMSCGGHPAPLLLLDEGEVEEAACRGELVGVFQAWEAQDSEVVLHPGDALVVYTDGAIEGRGPQGRFGEERLRAALRQGRGLSADELAEILERAVLEYIGESRQDDLAIVVLRLPSAGTAVDAAAAALANPAGAVS